MAHPVFNKETLLDALVNVVPLAMIVFFVALYVLNNPWNDGKLLETALQFALLVVPFVLLAFLTYEIAKRI